MGYYPSSFSRTERDYVRKLSSFVGVFGLNYEGEDVTVSHTTAGAVLPESVLVQAKGNFVLPVGRFTTLWVQDTVGCEKMIDACATGDRSVEIEDVASQMCALKLVTDALHRTIHARGQSK